MNQVKKIVAAIPHEFRKKILLSWLPNAKVSLADPNYQNLYNAYYIYVDPDAIKKPDCPICLKNIYDNWIRLQPDLIEAEREYYLIELL